MAFEKFVFLPQACEIVQSLNSIIWATTQEFNLEIHKIQPKSTT